MIVQLKNMTEAVRIKQALAAKGIPSRIIQTPQSLRRGGCGHSLAVSAGFLTAVEEAAKKTNGHILHIQRSEDG